MTLLLRAVGDARPFGGWGGAPRPREHVGVDQLGVELAISLSISADGRRFGFLVGDEHDESHGIFL
jgi:hypothetical protein